MAPRRNIKGVMQCVLQLSERCIYLKDAHSNYERHSVEECCRIVCWT